MNIYHSLKLNWILVTCVFICSIFSPGCRDSDPCDGQEQIFEQIGNDDHSGDCDEIDLQEKSGLNENEIDNQMLEIQSKVNRESDLDSSSLRSLEESTPTGIDSDGQPSTLESDDSSGLEQIRPASDTFENIDACDSCALLNRVGKQANKDPFSKDALRLFEIASNCQTVLERNRDSEKTSAVDATSSMADDYSQMNFIREKEGDASKSDNINEKKSRVKGSNHHQSIFGSRTSLARSFLCIGSLVLVPYLLHRFFCTQRDDLDMERIPSAPMGQVDQGVEEFDSRFEAPFVSPSSSLLAVETNVRADETKGEPNSHPLKDDDISEYLPGFGRNEQQERLKEVFVPSSWDSPSPAEKEFLRINERGLTEIMAFGKDTSDCCKISGMIAEIDHDLALVVSKDYGTKKKNSDLDPFPLLPKQVELDFPRQDSWIFDSSGKLLFSSSKDISSDTKASDESTYEAFRLLRKEIALILADHNLRKTQGDIDELAAKAMLSRAQQNEIPGLLQVYHHLNSTHPDLVPQGHRCTHFYWFDSRAALLHMKSTINYKTKHMNDGFSACIYFNVIRAVALDLDTMEWSEENVTVEKIFPVCCGHHDYDFCAN